MYARISRFTGVDADLIDSNVAAFKERVGDGPPEGVPSTGVKLFADRDNGTVVVVGFFASEEDLRTGDAALKEMTPPGGSMGEPSVDLCKIEFEVEAP